jgi:hypothetical protein
MKLTPFISGLLVIGLVASLMTLFITGVYTSYSDEMTLADYNGTKYAEYSQMESIYENLNKTRGSLEKMNSPYSDVTDKLSGFFSSVVGAVKSLLGVADTATMLIDTGTRDSKLGESADYVKMTLIALLVLGIIGILIKYYLKVDE